MRRKRRLEPTAAFKVVVLLGALLIATTLVNQIKIVSTNSIEITVRFPESRLILQPRLNTQQRDTSSKY